MSEKIISEKIAEAWHPEGDRRRFPYEPRVVRSLPHGPCSSVGIMEASDAALVVTLAEYLRVNSGAHARSRGGDPPQDGPNTSSADCLRRLGSIAVILAKY